MNTTNKKTEENKRNADGKTKKQPKKKRFQKFLI